MNPSGGRLTLPPSGTFYRPGQREREEEARLLEGLEGEISHLALGGSRMEEQAPRDVDFDHANNTIRQMRAPGCSEITAVQTYDCLDQLGLTKNIDVPRHAMRAAAAATMAAANREAREAQLAAAAVRRSKASAEAHDDPRTESSTSMLAGRKSIGGKGDDDTGDKGEGGVGQQKGRSGMRRSLMSSGRATSPVKLQPPKGLIYRAPIEALARSAGLRKQLANHIIRISVDEEEKTALNERVQGYHREKAANMTTDFAALHRLAIDGYDPRAAAMATEARREERERRGELVRARRAEVLRKMANRETRAEANERRKQAAVELARRQSQQRKLMAVVALHSRIKHAWHEVLVIRTIHKIHINQARASRVVQKHWRGYTARKRFQRLQRSIHILQPRIRLWYHRKNLRDGAKRIREFLEAVANGNEVIRRLHALRKSCAVIQAAFRSAFRTMSDQVEMFLLHWSFYERYVHMLRNENARRKEGTTETKKLKGGFKMTNLNELDELDARDMIPQDIKLKLVKKYLKVKQKQRAKDYEEHLDAIERWKKNSRQEAKIEMAKSVLEGKDVVLEEVEARILAKKPQRKWRRILMTPDELAKIHAEGEKMWQDEATFQDTAFGELLRLAR